MLQAVSLQHFAFGDFVLKVPRAGVEPARVAPLVFETSASTDSAIWASSFRRCFSEIGCKVNIII